jgi:hypothetical protein
VLVHRCTTYAESFMSTSANFDLLSRYAVGSAEWRWLAGFADLKESAELSGVSEDSLRRNHSDKIVRLGPRRLGMRRMTALSLGIPINA